MQVPKTDTRHNEDRSDGKAAMPLRLRRRLAYIGYSGSDERTLRRHMPECKHNA